MRALSLFLLVFLAGCGAPPHHSPFRATGETIAFSGGDGGAKAACATCHGLAGEGDGRESPRLAGLDAGYLHRQLSDYANGRRDHPMMRRIALRLSGRDRAKVAAYYAELAPPQREAGIGNSVGERLYHRGDPERGLAPCALCHGARGEGVGAGNPPLAGQPAAYLSNQLRAWREGKRRNDPLGEMREISRRLSPSEVAAVSAYAAGFAPPHPQDRAASRAAHRDGPRNDVSAPLRHGPGSSRPAGG